MKKKWDGIERRKSLRATAEALAANFAPGPNAQPVETLLHELMIHKIELEMQNDELRRTHAALEDALDRYRDLYKFAPVGYLTIDPEGLVNEINLTGSELLGVTPNAAIQHQFSTFVASQDRDAWQRQFITLKEYANGQKQSFGLKMTRPDGTAFYAHLDCLYRKAPDTPPILRVVLTDNGDINPAEKE